MVQERRVPFWVASHVVVAVAGTAEAAARVVSVDPPGVLPKISF